MEEIRQQIILIYITDFLNISSKSAANIIDPVSSDTNKSKFSKIKSGKQQKGYPDLDAKKFYMDFFKEIVEKISESEAQIKLAELQKFLKNEDIDCDQINQTAKKLNCDIDLPNEYSKFVMAMLQIGLPNIKTKPLGESIDNRTEYEKNPTSVLLHSQVFTVGDSFTGRDDLLQLIKFTLKAEYTVILYGFAGIGKTCLARSYAKACNKKYSCAQEVTFDSTAPTFKQAILSLKFDNLDEQYLSDEQKFQTRMSLLSDMDESTLLIIDNVDCEPEDPEVFAELRKNSKIHIIITTRSKEFFEDYKQISVNKLTDDKQKELFEYHLGRKIEADEIDDARNILHFIEGHTLAIELTAKTIRNGELSLCEMLSALKANNEDISLPSIKYHNTQDKLWHIIKNLFNFAQFSDDKKETMMYLSLLPAEGISRRMLIRNICKGQADNINELENYGWLIRADKRIRLHPLVREIIKSETKPSYKNCKSVIINLCDLIDRPEEFSEEICLISKSIVDTLGHTDSADFYSYLIKMAEFCNKNYKFRFALKIYETALNLIENSNAVTICDDMSKADLHLKIGKLYQRLAKYSKAIENFKTAINLYEDKSIPQGCAFRNLGEVFRKNSNYEEALNNDEKALNIFEKHTENYYKAEAQNAIGVVYLNKADNEKDSKKKDEYYSNAEKYYKDAFQTWLENQEYAEQLAFTTHNMGTLYHRLKDYDKAIKFHNKALSIRKENHLTETDIASSYTWLGKDYLEKGYLEKAKENINNGMKIREKLLGKNHPDYAWSLDTLSYYYEKMHQIDLAKSTMQDVITIRRKILGENHAYTKNAIARYKKLVNIENTP